MFLAAREGSYEACKALLDNFANREIADHMERLPRDVASERLHHDIVRLLDSHVAHPNAQTMVPVNNSFMSKSQRNRVARPLVPLPKNTSAATTPATDIDLGMCLFTDSQHMMSAHSSVNIPGLKLNNGNGVGSGGGSTKGKKRPKPSNPTSPADSIDSNVSLKRKSSVKNKPPPPLPPSAAMSSTAAAPTNKKPFGLDVVNGNMDLMALDVSRLYGVGGLPQQPPAYEECLSQLPAAPSQRQPMSNYGAAMHHQQHQHQQQQQQQQPDYRTIHQQLLGMQASFQEPSPPHSVVMSPSPGKTRPSLPTSPTHMQALRHATMQQAVDPFSQFTHHFYGSTQQPTGQSLLLQQPPQTQHNTQQYLTPPSDAAPESFPTPSPDSPWHWSSSSPNSNSDWSEGISSPPNNHNNNNNGHPNKVSDAVYI